ncbi:serine/threonine protein phosphatase Stp1 [Firmicutes bacterium CAG:882]|nr:serine/threonine protein phosphatase Stp1 [Firmicutes bacterium CAG:882]
MRAYAATDVGRIREVNQDYIFCSMEPVGKLPNLFLVADGMGGHKAGDLASRYTVETLTDSIKNSASDNPITIINDAIVEANTKLLEKAAESEQYTGMGTTLVVCTIIGESMYAANVGDSRLYLYDGRLSQITRDHSLVAEMVALGKLGRDEARRHEKKNVITRAIGGAKEIMADFFEAELTAGNRIIMCSDGLSNMVEDEEIERVLASDIPIEDKTKQLLGRANENGGKDNIAVVIIEL